MNRFALVMAAGTMLLTSGLAFGGSIYAKSSARSRELYTDDTARKIGDNLTIVITERGVIKNDTKRSGDRKSDRAMKITGKQDILNTANNATGKLFSLTDPLDVSISAEAKFDGEATFDSDRSVSDQMTVTVSDVLPNGNLVVIGQRVREIEGDKQTIQISGIVRVSDISYLNTIPSEKIAEFRIVYKHTGMENRYTKPAWLDRIFNIIEPF